MFATTPAPAPPMNHVFVDFENVQQVDLTLVGAKAVSFTLMVGAKQRWLGSGLVEKLMEHSASVLLVKLESCGKNALDFALAYYLGRAALADPTGYFHIISKDGGFDPLIEHLRARHIHVYRHNSCAELTFSWPGKTLPVRKPVEDMPVAKKVEAKKPGAKKASKKTAAARKTVAKTAVKKATKIVGKKVDSAEGLLERVLKDFREHPKARPKKRKALDAKVANLIKKPVDGPEVEAVIEGLRKQGQLTFNGKGIPEYYL